MILLVIAQTQSQAQVRFQAQMEAIVVIAIAVFLLVSLPLYVLRRLRASGDSSQWETMLERAWKKVGPEAERAPIVPIHFHTYSGFLVHFTQTEHRVELPLPIAIEYLRSLHRFNLRGCLVLYPGSLFVPVLSTASYIAQRSRIRRIATDARVPGDAPGE